ncbi:MAG: T9SS type A sorting domain-containing protein [Flavobacteriales bacterium]|nr:T9SS type A sorting domain-containing protein [Flavobacteriales bacterium]MBK9534401.1 T9SS type A sorting domain-containing protein [Flavobacteriales bacterium]MBP9137175.1 T9SS type A sorting domain-containing protein [Flavobacteriales bacterium]HQV50807.1 T9SS type A sorting domain-containing protein [Flavobacteriales bacterium]HQX31074.1 T9SS type A sorting domain-containing protein [Flavobacteriales bacterium]
MRLPSLLLIFGLSSASAQTLIPTLLTPLNIALNETSGMLVINGHVWTQLDSGNPSELYEVDITTGDVLRTVTVSNANNIDWEEITTDENWVYVGDFGNNSGSRTNLRIYRFPIAELSDPATTEVVVDTIAFSYADQIDFTPASNATNWDCEALLAMDDSLFLFTKNWENNECYLYSMSAEPGVHSAQRRDELDTQGMVTGASIDASGGVLLCGYTSILSPFIWQLYGYPGHEFFNGGADRRQVQLLFGQVEGITWSGPGTAYFTNEQNSFSDARFWMLGLDVITDVASTNPGESMVVAFDPWNDLITLRVEQSGIMRIFDARGQVVIEEHVQVGANTVSTASLVAGIYIVNTNTSAGPVRVAVMR